MCHNSGEYSRLRALGTAGLAAGLAASSHFDGCGWKRVMWMEKLGYEATLTSSVDECRKWWLFEMLMRDG
jgi:hypothetical protein